MITWLLWIYSGKITGLKLVEIIAEQFPTLSQGQVIITQLEHDPLGILHPNNIWHVLVADLFCYCLSHHFLTFSLFTEAGAQDVGLFKK